MTIIEAPDTPLLTLPAEGRDRHRRHRPADAGVGRGPRRRPHRGAALGRAVARSRQRRRRAARADRRLARHRPRRSRPPDPRLVGRRGRTRRADRHRPVVRDRHQRAGRLPRLDRAQFACAGRKTVGLAIPRDHGARPGQRRPRRARRRWASPRSPRSSAAPWAAPARWSGSSAIPNTVRAALVLAVGARATADQIGTQSTQVSAIKADPELAGRRLPRHRPLTRRSGMEIARRFAHLTYRGEAELDDRFGNDAQGNEDPIDRRPLRGAELPRAPGRQAGASLRRGHLRRADRRAEQSRRRPRPGRRGGGAGQGHGAGGRRRHHLRPAVPAAVAAGTGRPAARRARR